MTAKQRAHVEAQDEPDFFAAEVVKPIWFLVHEAEARELLMGRVPEDVREQARCAIDWQWDALRRGERPIVPSQKVR